MTYESFCTLWRPYFYSGYHMVLQFSCWIHVPQIHLKFTASFSVIWSKEHPVVQRYNINNLFNTYTGWYWVRRCQWCPQASPTTIILYAPIRKVSTFFFGELEGQATGKQFSIHSSIPYNTEYVEFNNCFIMVVKHVGRGASTISTIAHPLSDECVIIVIT